jgi:hypothetical protein
MANLYPDLSTGTAKAAAIAGHEFERSKVLGIGDGLKPTSGGS